jgi:anaerobic selenocysteine-containing dehydrogenase
MSACLPYLMLRKGDPFWLVSGTRHYKIGMGDQFPWRSEEELVAFELGPTGLTFKQLLEEKPEGAFYQQKQYGMKDGKFTTPSGKIDIYSEALKKVGFDPLPTYLEPRKSPFSSPELLKKYPLILSTGNRSLYFTHGQFRKISSLMEKNPEPKAEIGPKTAVQYGIKEGDDILIETNRGVARMKVQLEERVSEGVVLVPHGWPRESNANLLTDTECREPIMGYPDMKSLLCSIRKA